MNAEYIKFYTSDNTEHSIHNRWELLTAEIFRFLVRKLREYSVGLLSQEDVRFLYVCKSLGVKKMTDEEATANLIIISEQVDFIFDAEDRINSCFLAQLVPELEAKRQKYQAYKVNTSFDTLTCTLTALQFIEANEVLNSKTRQLPLLAAILYAPLPYSSVKAHEMAEDFVHLDITTLEAIALNFQAMVNYIFSRTHFSVLTAGDKKSTSEITTGMEETLYNLSSDGMGDVEIVEQMPVIKFLTILRKKLIESVRAMHEAKMDIVEISEKTGLPTNIIKKML